MKGKWFFERVTRKSNGLRRLVEARLVEATDRHEARH